MIFNRNIIFYSPCRLLSYKADNIINFRSTQTLTIIKKYFSLPRIYVYLKLKHKWKAFYYCTTWLMKLWNWTTTVKTQIVIWYVKSNKDMKQIMFSKRKVAGVLINTINYATISKSRYSNYKLTSQQREAINWDHLQNVSLQNVSYTKHFLQNVSCLKMFPVTKCVLA